jgi:uncharacterized membrane protein YeaQ/YmgE (transglycosylase-associated protein family)
MSLSAWVIMGLMTGLIGGKMLNATGQGFFGGIGLGIIGAIVGGWLFSAFAMQGGSGLNLWSLLAAMTGAAISLVMFHAICRPASPA